MKEILIRIKNNSLFIFILGGIIFGIIGVYGSNVYNSNSIEYSPTDASWEVSNVEDAINSLYSMKTELNNLKGIGDANAAQILSGKTVLVQGSTVTGTMTNRAAWTSTPTGSEKVTIPAGYHNGSGYVDTSQVYTNGYNAGTTGYKPPTISGSLYFVGNDKGTKDSITFPVSGYKTLTITSSNYDSGVRRAIITVGSTSYTIDKNQTTTINVSGYNAITIQSYVNSQSITWSASYTLSA